MHPDLTYLPDASVDAALDQELRTLLSTCFTKKQDGVFKTQRFFCDPYPHRFVIRNEGLKLVAHAGVHEKTVDIEESPVSVGGIGDLCVHPDARGRGYVRRMLETVHPWMRARGFVFMLLFGDPKVYGSSGYREADNLLHQNEPGEWVPVKTMVHELTARPWPQTTVRLLGRMF